MGFIKDFFKKTKDAQEELRQTAEVIDVKDTTKLQSLDKSIYDQTQKEGLADRICATIESKYGAIDVNRSAYDTTPLQPTQAQHAQAMAAMRSYGGMAVYSSQDIQRNSMDNLDAQGRPVLVSLSFSLAEEQQKLDQNPALQTVMQNVDAVKEEAIQIRQEAVDFGKSAPLQERFDNAVLQLASCQTAYNDLAQKRDEILQQFTMEQSRQNQVIMADVVSHPENYSVVLFAGQPSPSPMYEGKDNYYFIRSNISDLCICVQQDINNLGIKAVTVGDPARMEEQAQRANVGQSFAYMQMHPLTLTDKENVITTVAEAVYASANQPSVTNVNMASYDQMVQQATVNLKQSEQQLIEALNQQLLTINQTQPMERGEFSAVQIQRNMPADYSVMVSKIAQTASDLAQINNPALMCEADMRQRLVLDNGIPRSVCDTYLRVDNSVNIRISYDMNQKQPMSVAVAVDPAHGLTDVDREGTGAQEMTITKDWTQFRDAMDFEKNLPQFIKEAVEQAREQRDMNRETIEQDEISLDEK